eukprot:15030160-Ditylum_brightwellii.AAC.1
MDSFFGGPYMAKLKAKRTNWDTWRQLLKDGSSSTLTLQQPLDRWTGFLHDKSEWRFDPTTEMLYGSHQEGQWDTYIKVRAQPACRGATFYHTDIGRLPRHTQKTKISPASSKT